jgi:hypothetical protein
MQKTAVAVMSAIALVGCATAPTTPAMHPLTQNYIETLGPTPVVVSENNSGVEKSWFYTTTASAGAAYGLIGALVSATMDAIINAGPSHRAKKAANEVAELISVDSINTSLSEHIRQHIQTNAIAPTAVSYSSVATTQRLVVQTPQNDAVELSVSYTLSEDASTLRVLAVAAYQNTQTPYAAPYNFGGRAPRSEQQGPAYRNTFTYYSSQLPVPTLTPELKERLVQSIQDSSRDASGALPAEGAQEFRAMNAELEKARDDTLSKDEIAIFLAREWLQDGGARLRQEIEQAHEFIARYVLLDMNRAVVPTMTGQDELLETMPDARTIRRIGVGRESGSYVSSAGNVTSFSTYGNAIAIAEVNDHRIDALRADARRHHSQ